VTGNLTWNAVGTLGSLLIADPFNGSDTQSCSYAHDDLIRIASANCGSIWSQTFSYDAFGNISKTGNPGYSFQPSYSTNTNRMTSIGGSTPSYDANGDVTNDFLHSYSWDANGRPVTIDGAGLGLTYDALDRLVEQNRSGAYTQIVYSPSGDKLALMNGTTLQKGFVPLAGDAMAVYNSSGLAYYRHSDWLGSSRLASTPSRTIYSDGAYAPFGEAYVQTGAADLSFTGMNQDTVASLYDFPAREYGIQGRWPSPDPAGIAAVDPTDPQTWDRYAYVRNSPLNLVDPTGLCGETYTNWVWSPELGTFALYPTHGPPCDIFYLLQYFGYGGFAMWRPGQPPPTGGGAGAGSGGVGGQQKQQLAQQPCANPNLLNKLEIPLLAKAAGGLHETVGIGLSGSAGAGNGIGYAGGLSGYLAVGPNGDAAFVFTVGSVPVFGPVKAVGGWGGLFGPSVLISTAGNPQQLGGLGMSGGTTWGALFGGGAEVSIGSGAASFSLSAGFSGGGQGHAGVITNTRVIPVCRQ
jgi:RHS repeat-associated protein